MADEQQARDKYAFILVDCGITSSQEELLSHAKFAREDETFPDEDPPLEAAAKDDSRRKFDGGGPSGGSERKRGGEFVGGGVENAGGGNLGFGGERKSAREERESGPEVKKARVSPMVHCRCGERMRVIEVSGGLKVEIGSSSRVVVGEEDRGWTDKLDSEGVEDGGGGEGGGEVEERGVKRKLELVMDTEVINIDDDEEIEGEKVEKGGGGGGGKEGGEGCGECSRKMEGNEGGEGGVSVRGDGEEDGLRRGKRELPPSMYGLVWGEGTGDMITNMNMNRNRNRNGDGELEGGLKEISEEEKKDKEEGIGEMITNMNMNMNRNRNGDVELEGGLKGISEEEKNDNEEKKVEEKKEGNEDVAFKSILDVFSVIVPREEGSKVNTNSNIDLLETAKQCGLKFPRSRFLPEVEDDK